MDILAVREAMKFCADYIRGGNVSLCAHICAYTCFKKLVRGTVDHVLFLIYIRRGHL